MPGVDDRDRDIGARRIVGEPDEASDSEAALIPQAEGDDGFVVVVVHLGEVAKFARQQPRLRSEEP